MSSSFIKRETKLSSLDETSKKDRIKECKIVSSSPLEKVDRIISKVSKSICKIQIKTENELKIKKGSGFLLAFDIENKERFYCLISNEHVIKEELLNNDNDIYFSYDNEFRTANINLNNKERYMKSFKDMGLDITIIEILEEDNISKDYFLYPELEEKKDEEFIDSSIFIPQYPCGNELMNAKGKIKHINKYEFTHLANTDHGSSGSPIFLENSIRVLGIHKEGSIRRNENYGDFIYPVINIIKKTAKKNRNIDKNKNILNNNEKVNKYYSNWNALYICLTVFIPIVAIVIYYFLYKKKLFNENIVENGKIFFLNEEYYIGQLINELPNGKGKHYYSNGAIKYDGDWINGKYEGKGMYYINDYIFYIGEFKNGLRHGKGTEYYPNGNITYQGDFINDQFEGFGTYVLENGVYYVGEWKFGLRHGKGTLYYADGKIKYKGDWINDKFDGYGIYYLDNGDGQHYQGQFKNGEFHGKGAFYSSDGKIMHEGNFNK